MLKGATFLRSTSISYFYTQYTNNEQRGFLAQPSYCEEFSWQKTASPPNLMQINTGANFCSPRKITPRRSQSRSIFVLKTILLFTNNMLCSGFCGQESWQSMLWAKFGHFGYFDLMIQSLLERQVEPKHILMLLKD